MAERQSIQTPAGSGWEKMQTNKQVVPVGHHRAGAEERHQFQEQRAWVQARMRVALGMGLGSDPVMVLD